MVLYFLEMAPEADFRYSNWVQRIWSSNVANLSFNQSTCLELSKWYWLGVWKTRADTPILEVKTTAKMLQSLAKQSSAKMLQSSAEKCCKVRPGNCCKIRPRKVWPRKVWPRVQPRKVRPRKVRPRKFIAKYGREMLQKSAEKLLQSLAEKVQPENVP